LKGEEMDIDTSSRNIVVQDLIDEVTKHDQESAKLEQERARWHSLNVSRSNEIDNLYEEISCLESEFKNVQADMEELRHQCENIDTQVKAVTSNRTEMLELIKTTLAKETENENQLHNALETTQIATKELKTLCQSNLETIQDLKRQDNMLFGSFLNLLATTLSAESESGTTTS
jgi:chromosome segregation ATPase